MAGTRKNGSAERRAEREKENRSIPAYVTGTAVRQLDTMPAGQIQRKERQSVSASTRQNRERALQMNVRYVGFLTVAAVATMFMCVRYLQLQAKETRLQKEVTALEVTLDSATLENNSNYNRIMANVDMEHVKDVAMNELGMGYVTQSQIVEYDPDDTDYVRQYADVPEE